MFYDLKKVYGEAGFIEYTAEPEPEFKRNPERQSEGIVDLRVAIEEGKQFRIRSIKFLNDRLENNDLLQVVPFRAGDIFNQQLFEKGLSTVNEMKLFKDIDKDRDVDFRTDTESSVVDLVINVHNKDLETGWETNARACRAESQ